VVDALEENVFTQRAVAKPARSQCGTLSARLAKKVAFVSRGNEHELSARLDLFMEQRHHTEDVAEELGFPTAQFARAFKRGIG